MRVVLGHLLLGLLMLALGSSFHFEALFDHGLEKAAIAALQLVVIAAVLVPVVITYLVSLGQPQDGKVLRRLGRYLPETTTWLCWLAGWASAVLPAEHGLLAIVVVLGFVAILALLWLDLERHLGLLSRLLVPVGVPVAATLLTAGDSWLESEITIVGTSAFAVAALVSLVFCRGCQPPTLRGLARASAVGWIVALVALAHAISFGLRSQALDTPYGVFDNPASPEWLAMVTRSGKAAAEPGFGLARPGVGARARRTLALAEGLSRHLRGEIEQARAAYETCSDTAPCRSNLALLDCGEDNACLGRQLEQALDLPGDRAAAFYNLGRLKNDIALIEAAEDLAPYRVAMARRYRPDQPLLAAPDDVDLILAINYGKADLSQAIDLVLRRLSGEPNI